MTGAEIDRELIGFRRRLVAMAGRVGDGSLPGYQEIRDEADALTFLLEEAPEKKQAKIRYLLDRYEALLLSIVH